MKRYTLFAYYLLCIYFLQPPTDTVIKLILGGRDVAAKAKIQNILADSLQSFILSGINFSIMTSLGPYGFLLFTNVLQFLPFALSVRSG